jgi:NAD(P)-dependent dehydrogenase (short-subunit alcohol dehydrogenase family)
MWGRMSSRVAVVTGATGGIGRAVVDRLLTDGYRVLACMRHARPVVSRPGLHVACFDLATITPDELHAELEPFLHRHGPVALLVCAHGFRPAVSPFCSLSAVTIHDVFDTDVLGTIFMAQVVGQRMVASKNGSIVFISSLHARMTYPQRTAYALSKTALGGLARSLAVEWGPSNVRVNTILAWQTEGIRTQGFIDQGTREGKDILRLYHQRAPLGRLVTPEDIASTVVWLAQDNSVTGTEIVMDCGVSASMWYEPY